MRRFVPRPWTDLRWSGTEGVVGLGDLGGRIFSSIATGLHTMGSPSSHRAGQCEVDFPLRRKLHVTQALRWELTGIQIRFRFSTQIQLLFIFMVPLVGHQVSISHDQTDRQANSEMIRINFSP